MCACGGGWGGEGRKVRRRKDKGGKRNIERDKTAGVGDWEGEEN